MATNRKGGVSRRQTGLPGEGSHAEGSHNRRADSVTFLSQTQWLLRVLVRSRVMRSLALGLYVLASASVGFAHRPAALSVDLAQYALPDGTIPIICGGQGKDDKGGQRASRPPCDACCLTYAPGLPPPAASDAIVERRQIEAESLADHGLNPPSIIVAAHGPRGPPPV